MIKKKKESPAAVDVAATPMSALPSTKSDTFRIAGPYHILSPPIKKNMIHGHLVPTFRSATALSMLQQPHRLLTIELASSVPRSEAEQELQELHDNDRVILRVFRSSSDVSSPRTADGEDSVVTTTTDALNTSSNGNHWVEHKVYRLDEVELLKQIAKKDCVEIQLGLGNDTIVRDFRFVVPGAPTEPGMAHFCQTIERMKVLEQERAQRQLDQFKLEAVSPSAGTDTVASPSAVSNERIEILVEIVSATNLPISDLVATDAYIVVRFGTKEIHRTGVISNNLSPIFTLPTGSLFLLSYTPEEFFKQGTSGLSFTIKDYDTVGANDILGSVHVTLQELLKGTGQRTPYLIDLDPTAMDECSKERVPLLKDDEKKSDSADSKSPSPLKLLTPTLSAKKDPSTEKKKKPPMLYLRYRKASENDIHFMKEYQLHSKSGSHGIFANETFLPIRAMPYPKGHLLQREEKKNHQKEVLVRLTFGVFVVYLFLLSYIYRCVLLCSIVCALAPIRIVPMRKRNG
jgi:C2 domain